jgi:hypothetical protein
MQRCVTCGQESRVVWYKNTQGYNQAWCLFCPEPSGPGVEAGLSELPALGGEGEAP